LLATAHETIALSTQLGNQERVLDGCAFRMHLLIATGDVHGFAIDLRRFAQLAEELRQPFHQYHGLSMRAAQALLSGRFADAEALARAAIKLGARLPGLDASGAYGMQMFTIARERGELAQVAPLVRDFIRATPSAATWRPALALILAELGELEAAKTELEALAAENFQALPRDSLWLACVAYLAEVCECVGDRTHASALYALLAPWSGRNVVAGSVVVCYGPADRFLGMLCSVLGRWDDAERHFVAAVDMNTRQGATPWLAHTQYRYAGMLLERAQAGDHERARALMESALRLAKDLGMRSLQDRLVRLEQQFRPPTHAASYPAGLSRREAQVLCMIAAGKSNRQIADAIFRSPNTVANHVRSILAKVGAANRTEAATFAARQGLLSDTLTSMAK
jgi:DNA-binding CsgD family transcriptional regulator